MSLRKLQTGSYSDRGDKIGFTYYDTISLDGSTTSFRMFQAPWSGTKTKDLTNMKTGGYIPANQKFQVRSIGLIYLASAIRTTIVPILSFLGNTVCELIINGKDASYQKTLLQMAGIGYGVEFGTGAANTASVPMFNVIGKEDVLTIPIILAANVPFEIQLNSTVANAAAINTDKVKILLNGVLIRAM